MNSPIASQLSLDLHLYSNRFAKPEMSQTPVFHPFEQSPRYVRDVSPKQLDENDAIEYCEHDGGIDSSSFFGRADSNDLTELEPIMEEEDSPRSSHSSHRRSDLMISGFERLQGPPGFAMETDHSSHSYKDSEMSPRSDIFDYSPREYSTTATHGARAPVTATGRGKMESFEYTPRSVDDSLTSRRTSVESLLSRMSSDEYSSRRATMVPPYEFNVPPQVNEQQTGRHPTEFPWNEREKEHSLDTAIDRMFNAIVDDKDLYGGHDVHRSSVATAVTGNYGGSMSTTVGAAAVLPSGYVMIYEVRFKRSVSKYVLSTQAGAIAVGDLVKVEADRGHDLGIICGNYIRPISELSDEDRCLKHIVRRATHDEKMLLLAKLKDEIRALSVCREMSQRRNMPMTVLDAEFQFDRNKLTFLFTADKRIDFRELVRDLFALFKTRIWMQQIAPDGSIGMSPPSAPGNGQYSPPVLSPRMSHQVPSSKPQYVARETTPQFMMQQSAPPPLPQYIGGYGQGAVPPTAREQYMQPPQYGANPGGGVYPGAGGGNYLHASREAYLPYQSHQYVPNKPPLSPRENYRSPSVPSSGMGDNMFGMQGGSSMPPYDMEPSFAASVWAKIQEQQMQVQHLQAMLYKQQSAAQQQQMQQQQLRGKPKIKKDIALPPSSQSAVMTLKAATQSRSGQGMPNTRGDDIRLSPQLSPRMSEDSSSSSLDDINQSMQGMKFSSSYHNDI